MTVLSWPQSSLKLQLCLHYGVLCNNGSFWASLEVQACFIEAQQSSLQTNCGSAGCVSASRAFCCLDCIPSYPSSGGSDAQCCTEKSLWAVSGILESRCVCYSPVRALQCLMTTGVVLWDCWKSNVSPPPSHYLCWRKADKTAGSSSRCSRWQFSTEGVWTACYSSPFFPSFQPYWKKSTIKSIWGRKPALKGFKTLGTIKAILLFVISCTSLWWLFISAVMFEIWSRM